MYEGLKLEPQNQKQDNVIKADQTFHLPRTATHEIIYSTRFVIPTFIVQYDEIEFKLLVHRKRTTYGKHY